MTQEGLDFAPVLQEAQELGYAEADPTFDVEGVDTAHKIALLAALCFGTTVDFDQIYTEGISNISAIDIHFAEQMGYTIKLLAIGKSRGDKIEVRVHPTMIPKSYQLAQVNGVFNAVRLIGDFAGPTLLYGSGAGMDATASAVMGDVMSISRDLIAGGKPRISILGYNFDKIKKLPIMAMGEVVSNYYLRFTTKDQTSVLAKIAGCLGAHNISIESMLQPEKREVDSVSIVAMTHDAKEADIIAALEEIGQLDVVLQPTRLIRVENAPL
jgi:homoserine dehydrogenase